MECLSYSLLPNLINSSPAPNNSSTFRNISSGKWVCCHFLDTTQTWEPVSHNASTSFPCTPFLPSLSAQPAVLALRSKETSCSNHRQHLQLLFFSSSCIAIQIGLCTVAHSSVFYLTSLWTIPTDLTSSAAVKRYMVSSLFSTLNATGTIFMPGHTLFYRRDLWPFPWNSAGEGFISFIFILSFCRPREKLWTNMPCTKVGSHFSSESVS